MHFARQILITTAVCLCAALPTAVAGKENTEPLYDLHEARVLKAREFKSAGDNFSFVETEYKTMALFSVPQDNSIGTIDRDDAITLISFPGKVIKFNNTFKNNIPDKDIRYGFCSVSFDGGVLISHRNEVFVFDYKEKTVQKHQMDSFVRSMEVSDPSSRTFIFEIDDHLKLFDLSGNIPRLIMEIDLSNIKTWSFGSGNFFLYNSGAKQIRVLDANLEQVEHPLPRLFKHHRTKYDIFEICPHPSLPFAVVDYEQGGPKIIEWGEGGSSTPISIFGDEEHFTDYSFSPDGRWIVLRVEHLYESPEKTYLIPVSEKYPHYLGPPMLLAFVNFERDGLAWTTNPVSLVGSSGKKIYRWELTNEAHPESDKASYWDYVVERDLKSPKRMAVEKKIEDVRTIGKQTRPAPEKKPANTAKILNDKEIWGSYKKEVDGSRISLSVRPVESANGPGKAVVNLGLTQEDGSTLDISGEGIVRGQTVVAYSRKFRVTVTGLGTEADFLLEESCGDHRFYEGYGHYDKDCVLDRYHSLDSLSSGLEKVGGHWR